MVYKTGIAERRFTMNEQKEIIEMLKIIYERGEVLPMTVCMEENYPPLKTTVIPDISYESFEWVLRTAIKYLKEH